MAGTEQLLAECLEAVERGAAIEVCLARYPEHREELEPLLRAAQRVRTAPTVGPSADFRKGARERMVMLIQDCKASAEQSGTAETAGLLERLWARVAPALLMRRLAVPTLAALSVIFLVGVLSVGAVYASSDAVPGDHLYAVKLAGERLRLALARDETAQAELHLRLAGERLEEAEALVEQDRPEEIQALMRKNLYNFALLNVRQLFLAIGNENEEINNNNNNYFGLDDLIRIYKKGLDKRKTGNLSEEEIRSRFESLKRNVRFRNWDSVYKDLAWLFKYHKDYTSLSYSVVSQQVLRRLKDEITGFGEKMELYWKGELKDRPSLPKYLPKDGERGIVYPKQMLDLKGVRQRMDAGRYESTKYNTHTIPVPIPNKDLDKFPKIRMDFSIFESIDDFFNRLKEVRIRPEGNYYMCDVVYSIGPSPKDYDLSNTRVLAIDFGSNNFVTTVNNIEEHPELIKARKIKKANYLIDSQYRELQSEFDCLNHIKYQHSRRQTPILEAIEKGINIIKERRDNIYGVKGKKRNPRLVELQNLIDDLTNKLTKNRFELSQNSLNNSQNKISLNFPEGNTLNSNQFAFLEFERLRNEKVKFEKELKHSLANKKYIISKYNEKISVYSRIMDSLLVLPADQYFHYITERMNIIKKRFLDIFANRNRLITDRLHKISKYLINYCLIHKIGVIIVGYNAGWKQNGSIGKKNNRIFQKLPHSYLLEKLKYKAKYIGIRVIEINEYNTSRCSALDLESLNKESGFIGQRGLRIDPKSKDPRSRPYYTHSLFKSKHYGIIHSDVNGGLNIVRRSDEFRKLFENYIFINRESNRKIFNPKKVRDLDNALRKQNQQLLIQV
ncbi:MAG: IS200/IS605 family accessory protein TnpB-related protein [Kosmotogaceae bacterium]